MVRTFLTHSEGRPRTYGVVVDQRRGHALSKWDLQALAGIANRHPGACAFGKLVLLRTDGIFTFQACRNGDLSPTFCGNSTAAGISCLETSGPIRTKVHGIRRRSYNIHARIEGDIIAQSWIVPSEAVQVRRWRGCRAIFLPTLNPYAILLGPLPEDIRPETALQHLRAAALATKLAVVAGTAEAPIIEFYNANGKHGAAPQTGLATMALAARSAPSLKALFTNGCFSYATADGPRVAVLPTITDSNCGRLAIEMPAVSVSFDPVAIETIA